MNPIRRIPMGGARILLALLMAALLVFAVTACGGSSNSSSSSTTESEGASGGEGGAEGGETETASSEEASYPPESSSPNFPNYTEKYGPKGVKPAQEPYKVAVLLPATELPSQQSLGQGFEEGAKALNIELTVFNAGGFENVAKQVSQFETAIGEKPDAIVVIPTSPVAFNSQVDKAVADGIDVFGALIAPLDKNVSYTLADPLEEDGEKSVEALAEAISEEGEIFGIFGGAGGAPNTLFAAGAKKALARYPKIKEVFNKNLTNYNPAEAQSAVEDALVSNPDVDGILTNSTAMAPGVTRALQSAGKEELPVTGLGPNDTAEIEEIEAGTIAVGVTPPFYSVGGLTLEWALAVAEGQKPPEPTTEMESMVFTTESMQEGISSGAVFQALAPNVLGCGPGQDSEC
jgi:periplasmic protein TorT